MATDEGCLWTSIVERGENYPHADLTPAIAANRPARDNAELLHPLLFVYVCIYSLSGITAPMQDNTACGISCKERARRSQNTSTASYQCAQEHPVQNLRNFLSRQTSCISWTNLEAYTLGLQCFTQKMHMHTHSLQSDSQPLRTNCHDLAFSK